MTTATGAKACPWATTKTASDSAWQVKERAKVMASSPGSAPAHPSSLVSGPIWLPPTMAPPCGSMSTVLLRPNPPNSREISSMHPPHLLWVATSMTMSVSPWSAPSTPPPYSTPPSLPKPLSHAIKKAKIKKAKPWPFCLSWPLPPTSWLAPTSNTPQPIPSA